MFCKLTDAQIQKYSSILSKVSDISDLSTFPDYSTFALWIGGILRDPKSVREQTAKRIFKALYEKTDLSDDNFQRPQYQFSGIERSLKIVISKKNVFK